MWKNKANIFVSVKQKPTMKPNGTYNKLIKEADNFFNIALKEYRKGKKEKNDRAIRQGAEKAWNAAVQATKALVVKNGKNIPRGFNAQLMMLREFAKKQHTIINGYPLLSSMYLRFASRMHGEYFYHGEYSIDELNFDFDDVKQYIRIIKNICKIQK
jgi:DNA mismatch repair ATPase MutS